jgi:hypothetical protein
LKILNHGIQFFKNYSVVNVLRNQRLIFPIQKVISSKVSYILEKFDTSCDKNYEGALIDVDHMDVRNSLQMTFKRKLGLIELD